MFISSGLLNILCGADGPGLQKGMEYISRRHILVKYISKFPGGIYLKISASIFWDVPRFPPKKSLSVLAFHSEGYKMHLPAFRLKGG